MSALAFVKLGSVAQYLRGINFKPDDVVPVGSPGTVACMRTKNIQEALDCADVWGVDKSFVRRTEQILQEGDILVSSANSWNLVGKCCWIPALPWEATFGGFVSTLRAKSEIADPRFLYWWFSSDRTQALLRSFGQKTTNISNLNAERCLNLDFPLLPISEQRRIAAILDQADALRAKRREALAQLDRLTQSIFIEMFGEISANTKGWRTCTVGDVSNCIVPGRDKPRSFSGCTPWVTTSDLKHLELTLGSLNKTGLSETEIEEVRAKVIPLGSVIISCVGDLGIVSIAAIPMVVNQQLHTFQCHSALNNTFLMYCLASQKPYMLAKASSTTLPYMNKSVCSSIPVVVPPLALQQTFAARIQSVEALKASHRAALQSLDKLFASLQHRAFAGEL
ncbi:MAG: restriction endonuclease subunit S [Burkholderiales bacterium]|nr:restriction endonuclease subunit S [Burkholderiales bacterium]